MKTPRRHLDISFWVSGLAFAWALIQPLDAGTPSSWRVPAMLIALFSPIWFGVALGRYASAHGRRGGWWAVGALSVYPLSGIPMYVVSFLLKPVEEAVARHR